MAPNQQTLLELGNLALKLAGNPKTRRQFLKQVKEVDPNYRAPADVQLEEFKEETKREREEERIRYNAQVQQARSGQARQKLISDGRYTEDQVKEIEEKVMKRYGLHDYEAASKLYAADLEPTKPSNNQRGRHGQIWEFPDLPGLLQNPEKAASDAAYAVIDELRSGRR
jgi:hypothetical protein